MSKRTEEEMNNDAARVEDSLKEIAAKDTTDAGSGDKVSRYEQLERLKREKRLAMNRVHARNRRANEKMLLETLEMQVQELTKKNAAMEEEKEALLTRVALLQVELKKTNAELALSMSSSAVRGGATAGLLGAPAIKGGFQLPPSRAALAGLISPPLAATSSSSFGEGSPFLGGQGPSTNSAAMEGAEKLRYMDLLQRTATRNRLTSPSFPSSATMEYENRVKNLFLASALAQRQLAGSSGRFY